MTAPTSTYRLQVGPAFDLDAAAGVVDYLARLGVGAVYTSPLLAAAPGSTHGYDVVDPTRASPALGGEDARARLVDAVRAAGLSLVVDVVPNHMSVESQWWWDVLARGPASAYASYFDIDFAAGPILLPVLGDEGALELRGDRLAYFEHEFPLAPGTSGGSAEEVHERQHYRLVHWRRGNAELTYRRFFDITTLAAVRVEDPAVFAATHAEVLRWVAAGEVAGLRVDHPDGLTDPGGYLRRLHAAAPGAWLVVEKILAPGESLPASWPVAGTTGYDALREICGVFVDPAGEAPLTRLADVGHQPTDPTGSGHGRLPESEAPVGLRHPESAAPLGFRPHESAASVGLRPPESHATSEHRQNPAPRTQPSPEPGPAPREGQELSAPSGTLETGGRRPNSLDAGPMPTSLSESPTPPPLNENPTPPSLGKSPTPPPLNENPTPTSLNAGPRPTSFAATAEQCRRLITQTSLVAEMRRIAALAGAPAEAVAEIMVAFPVYRSYLPEGLDHWMAAAGRAKASRPDLAGPIDTIDRAVRADPNSELATRIQQTSGMVVAKGDEDTASYRYPRLVALNEVGGDPDRFGVAVAEFHAAAAARAAGWPATMTTLSTHDTKRAEDVRARLAVLAELPGEWAAAVARWTREHGIDEPALNLLAWQTLVGAWPITADRLSAYLDKAAKEAKLRTSWIDHDEAFEAAVRAWPATVLESGTAAEVARFVARIRMPGWSNSLGQKIVQLAGPGVPDVYQGSELFDLSLVDPDNRRPVDFAHRAQLISKLEAGWLPELDGSGAAKLHVVRQVLRLRRERPDLFTGYRPLFAQGPAARHALAFTRAPGLAVVATRLPVGLARAGGWRDTVLPLPPGDWHDLLTGREAAPGLGQLLARYPVALLRGTP